MIVPRGPGINTDGHKAESTGLFLLFEEGKRPSRVAIRNFEMANRRVSLTHDPAADSPIHLVAADGDYTAHARERLAAKQWVELLCDGLTFDLVGLAPGEAVDMPTFEHSFDMEQTPAAMRLETMQLKPGSHLAGGERSMPVAKGLVGLARDLVHHFDDLVAVVFEPSQSVIGRRYFESVATAWLEGGPFPALGLTAFKDTLDGALQSVGLDHWIGQELQVEPPLSAEKVAATRLAVRIVNQLVLIGGIEGSERITAPDGTSLVLRPSRNGRYIRVNRE